MSFNRTLDKGIKRFKGAAADAKQQGQKDIDSKVAFEMWDTYGFPIDLTQVSDDLRNGMSTKKVLNGTASRRSSHAHAAKEQPLCHATARSCAACVPKYKHSSAGLL